MLFCALHLEHEDMLMGEDDEVYLVVPNGSKTALAVPLDALPEFLPILERALGTESLPTCRACGAEIPRLAYERHHRPDDDRG